MGLRTELFEFLIAIPGFEDTPYRKAMVNATGNPALRTNLRYDGSVLEFFDGLLNYFGRRPPAELVGFLQSLESAPQLDVERKLYLPQLRGRLDELAAAEWNREFASIHHGATPDDILAALRSRGLLSRVATQIPEDRFRKLLEILAHVTVSEDSLFRAYRATLQPTARIVNSTTHALLLADLCEQPLEKPWPPPVEYVERLARAEGIEIAVAKELREWVDASAPLLMPPTPAKEIKGLREHLQAEAAKVEAPDAISWLQIFLESDSQNRTLERKVPDFLVELVLWSPQMNGPLVLDAKKLSKDGQQIKLHWQLDELADLLDLFFNCQEMVSLIPDLQRLVIEIFAPSDVLTYGFNRWKRNKSKITYGAVHPIVVRLQDRLVIPFAADQKLADECWSRRWTIFRNSVCHQGCEDLDWKAKQDLDLLELRGDKELACLGLSSPLAVEGREFFEILRDAGIPIAIWLRGQDLSPDALANWLNDIMGLIKGKQLWELRHTLRDLRSDKKVRADEGHVANAVTLMWDEPDRPALKYGNQGVFV